MEDHLGVTERYYTELLQLLKSNRIRYKYSGIDYYKYEILQQKVLHPARVILGKIPKDTRVFK